jgi:sulfite reductase (ferredoxin)
MAATPQNPASAPRRKVSRHRGEGQWAMGHFTPLNGNEQFKKDDDGLNVRTRIETIYSKRGFDSIDPNDLRGRMRWWGLYTQRKPGIDGGKTAILEPEELDDKYFMLRVRIDGGRLTTQQLRVIGEISQEFARGSADVTDRQNIQLHWIRIEDVPEIWQRLEAVGLSTTEACGDTPRVVIGSPVAGIAEDEIIDGSWAIDEINKRYIGSKEFSNLPRKFKSAISGSPLLDVVHEINDIAFVGVEHPEHGPGFDLWVGGGLSTNPKIGVRLGAWVPLAEVPDVWAGVIGIFRDYGYRRLRTRARLKFLVADWGAEKFRQVLEDEYLKRSLVDGPAPAEPVSRWRDHVGVHRQQDGNFYVGFAPRVGRVDGATLAKIADLAEAHGSGRVRTTVEQKMIVLDVAEDQVESLVEALEALDLTARHHGLHRHRVLQARDRRDQAARLHPDRRAGAAAARVRRAAHHQHQRLPERLRPYPGRGHRSQGPAGPERRGRAGRGLPGAPGRRARPGGRVRPQGPRSQGDLGGAAGLRRAGAQALPGGARGRRAVRRLGRPRQ